jgi:hypothetical protein
MYMALSPQSLTRWRINLSYEAQYPVPNSQRFKAETILFFFSYPLPQHATQG